MNMRTMARVLLSAVALNVASFATAGAQTNYYGESLDTVVTLDRSATVDLSLFKNFAITESARLQFRAEAFNTLNHANFALPENDIASPAFGQILQAAPPRLLQLALKVSF